IADHHDPALCADALFAATELGGFHVTLQDVDALFGFERDTGDLVEAHDVVLGYETSSPGSIVNEHVGDGRLPARHEMRVRRHLLEQVRLASAPGSELNGVV